MGYIINHKKVQRLMHELGLFAKQPRAKYKSYKGEVGKTYNNKLLIMEVDETNHKTIYKRDFSTNKLNEKWTTDVSEFHIAAGKLYLSPILDMHNREIVSFNISRSPNFEQTLDMLNKAFEKYDDLSGLIFHSDQGWQYQMESYRNILKEKGIICDSLENPKYNQYPYVVLGNTFWKQSLVEQLKKEKKTIFTYQEMIRYLANQYPSIAICGTHGKTTTAHLIETMLSANHTCSYIIGDGEGKGG